MNKKYYLKIVKHMQNWAKRNMLNLFIFNTILTLILLLRSAGYFSPFFSLSISFVVALCLVLSVIILGARSRVLFMVAILFWLLATFFKIMRVDIWAERAAIYTFEALLVALVVFFMEKITFHNE